MTLVSFCGLVKELFNYKIISILIQGVHSTNTRMRGQEKLWFSVTSKYIFSDEEKFIYFPFVI